VLTLTKGTKIFVAETDDEVVAAVRRWKIDVMTEALDAADSRPRTF
jgi:uncharacterized protein YlzI (FlbEa/FlbD family)